MIANQINWRFEMADKEKKTEDRVFTVMGNARNQVGPWIGGSVFTEAEFKFANPVHADSMNAINPETYYSDLLERLLAAGGHY